MYVGLAYVINRYLSEVFVPSHTHRTTGNVTFNLPRPMQCLCSIKQEADTDKYSSDGFALNVGRDSWQSDRVQDAYTAAQSLGSSFKLFLSLDMTY